MSRCQLLPVIANILVGHDRNLIQWSTCNKQNPFHPKSCGRLFILMYYADKALIECFVLVLKIEIGPFTYLHTCRYTNLSRWCKIEKIFLEKLYHCRFSISHCWVVLISFDVICHCSEFVLEQPNSAECYTRCTKWNWHASFLFLAFLPSGQAKIQPHSLHLVHTWNLGGAKKFTNKLIKTSGIFYIF